MGNTLAVFADGTWNDPYDKTNVNRLFHVLTGDAYPYEKTKQIGEYVQKTDYDQIAFYLDGVGANGEWRSLLSGALGIGLHAKVLDAYLLLSQVYSGAEDSIALFGFSRGAYTVRSLAGMICTMGLLKTQFALNDPQARRLANNIWWQYKLKTHGHSGAFRKIFEMSPEELDKYLTPVESIKVVGVWDTVGALGIPKINRIPAVQSWQEHVFDFADCDLSPKVELGLQALALDERRDDYAPCVWTSGNILQAWFPGVHCDVGGGYSEHSLSDITLDWMLQHVPKGLLYVDTVLPDFSPDPSGPIHDECQSPVFKGTCNTVRGIGPGQKTDASVRVRMMEVPEYRPPQIPYP